jgi:hypothetical protein
MSDNFNIDQSKATNPSTNLAKDSSKQQVNLTNTVQAQKQSLVNAISEIEELFNTLAERYPNASEPQKQIVLQMELEQLAKNDPSLRDRFLGAAKAGSIELVKVLTNNPFVSVPLETAKGWFEAESGHK